jgi:hypothetical protein
MPPSFCFIYNEKEPDEEAKPALVRRNTAMVGGDVESGCDA